MKVTKGNNGYIKTQKRNIFVQSCIGFGIVAALLIAGYITTGTKLNLLTMVAILGCLPAAKVLVGFLALAPYKSIQEEKASEIKEKAESLTISFDMVITSREKIMPVDAIVISNNTVCGYVSNSKTNETEAANHIKNILNENRLNKVTVKLFSDYTAFISRAEGMNSIAVIERTDAKTLEEQIKKIILNISM